MRNCLATSISLLVFCAGAWAQEVSAVRNLPAENSSKKKPTAIEDKKDTPKMAPAEAVKSFKELQAGYQKLSQEAMKDFLAARPEDKAKALALAQEKLKKLPRAEFAQRSLQLAQSIEPKDATSFPALMYALNLSRDSDHPEIADAAYGLVLKRHIDHPQIGQNLTLIAIAGTKGLETLHTIARESKVKAVKGQAYLTLAQQLQRSADDEQAISRAEALYAMLAKDYADLKIGKSTIGVVAKAALAEMNFLKVGTKAPEVDCLNIDGDKRDKLSNYQGKVIVLDFWATWCGPCKAMIPHEREMVARLKDKPFALISISGDSQKETLVQFLAKEKMPWVHWFAEGKGILQDWKIRSLPTIYIIDHKGVIRAKGLRGNDLEAKVNELLAELQKEKVG